MTAQNDSPELEALFDSVASRRAAPATQDGAAAVKNKPDVNGDSEELQALFDSVTERKTTESARAGGVAPEEQGRHEGTDAEKAQMFTRIGHMTRQVHETLHELGMDVALRDLAEALPDTRNRLAYIARMTEQAATRVLNAVEEAQPIQSQLNDRSGALLNQWDALLEGRLDLESFKQLARETRDFMAFSNARSQASTKLLRDIMMAQDFQDLTGQVIKKTVELAQDIENQLCEILIEFAPQDRHLNAGLMNGPVIVPDAAGDAVTNQKQVDDLLESLGF